jgi:release factor glutamine methyltransferase
VTGDVVVDAAVDVTTDSWRDALAGVVVQLADAGVDNAAQEARWIVEQATGWTATELATRLDEPAADPASERARDMAARRSVGEPLQYVLGRWQFRSLDLGVDRRVLVPRPETEVLAGMALDECRRLDARVAVDLGTGSGAIALALAVERPGLAVWATDASADALAVARTNLAAVSAGADRVQLVEGRWFDALSPELAGRIDVMVSNPPYVSDAEMAELPAEVRDWEPHAALRAGATGLEDVEHIVTHAPEWLARPGALLVEIAPHQADAARTLARHAGWPVATVWPDLAGRDRILLLRR